MRNYYPEFDTEEYEETIVPLGSGDERIRAAAGRGAQRPRARIEVDGFDAETSPFETLLDAFAVSEASAFAAVGEVDADGLRMSLEETIRERLRPLYIRALIADVNRAREENLLAGDSPQERYRDYVRRWDDDFRRDLEIALPMLPLVHRTIVEGTLAAFGEMLARVASDARVLGSFVGCTPLPRLVRAHAAGDTHGFGRAVTILEFENGLRCVYKPRSVDGEAGYARLVASLRDALGIEAAAARVLDEDGYGYMEWIEKSTLATPEPGFVERSGELGALLYALNARDMHTENVAATSAGPVPLDLETLLHPRRNDIGDPAEAPRNAHEVMAGSVYGVGILPLIISRSDDARGHVDAGFLGLGDRGPSPYRSLSIRNAFRDDMTLALESPSAPPRTEGAESLALSESDVRDLAAAFRAGFERVYRRIIAHRETFASIVEHAFANAQLRYVHTPTIVYAQSLRMLTSTHALAHVDDYVAIAKRIGIAGKRVDPQLVISEAEQLAGADIPAFTCRVAEGIVFGGDGRPTGATLRSTPWEDFRRKLDHMGELDLNQQRRLIGAAFTAQFPDNHLPPRQDEKRQPGRSDDDLHGLARRIGDDLADTVLPDRFAHLPQTWIGPLASYTAERPWPPGVLGYDLYTGRTGPALALAALAAFQDDRRYRAIPEQIFGTSAAILEEGRFEPRSILAIGPGGFTGMAGMLWALHEAGRLLGRHEWQDAARSAVPLALTAADDAGVDVIVGSAGRLLALADFAADIPAVRDAAGAAVVTAVAAAERDASMGSGFAHGIAGLLYAATVLPVDDTVRRPAVERLLARLDDFFDDASGDWRTNASPMASWATGWCHGSSGIALALGAASAAGYGREVGDRLDVALRRMHAHGFGRNITLCHGDMGNLDVLRYLRSAGQDVDEQIERAYRRLPAPVIDERLTSADSRYAHTNSIMVGSSGVLLSLLRRLDPEGVRSPLLWGSAA